jgi:hypothetical protein
VRIQKIALALSGIIALGLVGCASTTIYPGPNNSYSLVTTSGDQGYAEKDAEKKAEEYCQKKGQQLVVLNHKTEYHGVDKNNAAMIGLASAILTRGGNPASSNQDYQVTMNFTCK